MKKQFADYINQFLDSKLNTIYKKKELYKTLSEKYNIDVNFPFEYLDFNEFPLLLIENKKEEDLPMFKRLIEHGANINVCLTKIVNILFKKGHHSTLNYIIDLGYDIKKSLENFIEPIGNILFFEFNVNNVELIYILFRAGFDITMENNFLVYMAIKNGSKKVVEYVIQKGFDVNSNKGLPILLSIYYENYEITRLLVENGANVNVSRSYRKLYNPNCSFFIDHGYLSKFMENLKKNDSYEYNLYGHDENSIDIEFVHNYDSILKIVKKIDITAIEYVCFRGCVEMIDYLFEKGVDINVNEGNALIISILYDNYECFERLVELGADVRTQNDLPIQLAFEKNKTELFYKLIEKGCKLKDTDVYFFPLKTRIVYCDNSNRNHFFKPSDKCPLFYMAVRKGYSELVDYVLKNDLNLNYDIDIAFMNAVEFSHCDVANVLLKYSASVHCYSNLAIIIATKNNDLKMVDFLIKHKCKIDAKFHFKSFSDYYDKIINKFKKNKQSESDHESDSFQGIINLNNSISSNLSIYSNISDGSFSNIDENLSENLSIDTFIKQNVLYYDEYDDNKSDSEESIIDSQKCYASIPIIKQDFTNYTALTFACKNNCIDMIQKLLDYNVTIVDEINGMHSLYYAINNDSLKIIKILIEKGASILEDVFIMRFAFLKGNPEIIQYLVEKGASVYYYPKSPIFSAIHNGSLSNLTMLLDMNIGENSLNIGLNYAVQKCLYDICYILIHYGADVNNSNGLPMKRAIEGGNHSIVELLITNGCNCNEYYILSNKIRHIPLYYACLGEEISIIELLIKKGAKVNAESNIVLKACCKNIHYGLEFIKFLYKKGLNIFYNNNIAYKYARKYNNQDVMFFLEDQGATPPPVFLTIPNSYTLKENEICPISFELIDKCLNENLVCNNCKNIFYSKSLIKWLVSNSTCPVCRVDLENAHHILRKKGFNDYEEVLKKKNVIFKLEKQKNV